MPPTGLQVWTTHPKLIVRTLLSCCSIVVVAVVAVFCCTCCSVFLLSSLCVLVVELLLFVFLLKLLLLLLLVLLCLCFVLPSFPSPSSSFGLSSGPNTIPGLRRLSGSCTGSESHILACNAPRSTEVTGSECTEGLDEVAVECGELQRKGLGGEWCPL